jgi:ABC-2 type transport system permease protein
VPAAIGDGLEVQTVGVVGSNPPGVEQAAVVAGKVAGVDTVFVEQLPSEAAARKALVDGTVDVVVVNRQVVLVKKQPTAGVETTSSALADSLAQLIGLNRAFAAMPQNAEGQIADNIKLPIRGVEPPGSELESRVAGMAAVLIIYMFILVNGMKITQGVAEEKSTRVIEVLLSGVRPLQLLIGKVAGIGAAAGLQLLAMLAMFLAGALIAEKDLIRGDAGEAVLAGAIWLVLGYALFCTLFAAAGALISRQSDASSVSFPLLLPLVVAFTLSVTVLFSESGTFFNVLAYFPLTAPIAMPTLYAIVDGDHGDHDGLRVSNLSKDL